MTRRTFLCHPHENGRLSLHVICDEHLFAACTEKSRSKEIGKVMKKARIDMTNPEMGSSKCCEIHRRDLVEKSSRIQ